MKATEVRVSRITTVVLGIVAIVLGVLFEKVNVAFMVGLAFAVAASANFPVLLLCDHVEGPDDARRGDRRLCRPDQLAGADDREPRRLGGGVRLPEGLGAVPLTYRRPSSRSRCRFSAAGCSR